MVICPHFFGGGAVAMYLFHFFLFFFSTQARVRNTFEPLCVFAVCVWLAYGAGGEAGSHHEEATIMGSLLAASFLLSAASLGMGLRFGGRYDKRIARIFRVCSMRCNLCDNSRTRLINGPVLCSSYLPPWAWAFASAAGMISVLPE